MLLALSVSTPGMWARGRVDIHVGTRQLLFINLKVASVGDWVAAGTLPCPRPAKQNIYGKTFFASLSWPADWPD